MALDESNPAARALDEEARAWVRRLNSGQATGRDARQLKQWCALSDAHRDAFTRARKEWRDIAQVAAVHQQLFAAVAPVAARTVDAPRRRRFLGAAVSGAGIAMAGAAVAVWHPPLGLWPSWSELAADYRTGTGEQRSLAFADHIELTLNTQTSIAVQAGADNAGRDLRLIAGEAAVQRSAGAAPLALLAGVGRILAGVGTVEVKRSNEGGGDRYCVTCTDGVAELRHPSLGTALALRARDQVWYDRFSVAAVNAISAVGMEQAEAWRRGMVVFRNTPLIEAVAEINRYRSGRVVLRGNALAQRRLSGYFRVDGLDEAVLQIEQVFGASVTRLPGGVVILS
jgi:transmembrane sensor